MKSSRRGPSRRSGTMASMSYWFYKAPCDIIFSVPTCEASSVSLDCSMSLVISGWNIALTNHSGRTFGWCKTFVIEIATWSCRIRNKHEGATKPFFDKAYFLGSTTTSHKDVQWANTGANVVDSGTITVPNVKPSFETMTSAVAS